MDFQEPREKAGFKKGLPTIDHIHAIGEVAEKSAECSKPLYIVLINYKKPPHLPTPPQNSTE